MKFISTGFKELYVIEPLSQRDERGSFTRLYCEKEFSEINFLKKFVQVNSSFNVKKGTLRGLHYQLPPFEETKLIKCVSGKVFDVVVDIREKSATYLKWFGVELSKQNMKMILIPDGFAHGFLTLEDNTELIYCHTEFYNPSAERGICYNDEVLNIQWPSDIIKVSEKDRKYPLIINTKF